MAYAHITRGEVFADKIDPDHPVGEITRIGGGKFRFVGFDGRWETNEDGERLRFDTYEECLAYALECAAFVEAEPNQFAGKIAFDVAVAEANAAAEAARAEAAEAQRLAAEARAELGRAQAERDAAQALVDTHETTISQQKTAIIDLKSRVANGAPSEE